MAGWSLTWGEHEWTAADMTGDHAVLVAASLGGDTWDVSPVSGVVHLVAVLAAFVSLAESRSLLEVVAEVRAAPFAVLVGALSLDGE